MIIALGKVWRLFTAAERRKAKWVLLLVILMALLETVGVISIMPFLSVLGRPEIIHENAWLSELYQKLGAESDQSFILLLGLASIVLVVGSSLFKTLALHTLNRFVHLQRHSLSVRLLTRYLHQPYEFFLTRNSSELSKNILSEVDMLVNNLVLPVGQMIAQGFIVLAMATLIVFYDPIMAVNMLVLVAAVYGFIYALVRRRLGRIGAESQKANKERFQSCNEALSGIKDIKINNAIQAYLSRFDHSARLFARHQATNDTISQTPLYLIEATGYTALILLAITLMIRSGDVGEVLPALGLYGLAAYRMLPAAQIIYRGFAKMRFSTAALEKISNDFLLPAQHTATDIKPLIPTREIRLKNISFSYPSANEKPILENFSLTIPINSSLAITGRSGAGKSTLMDILLGLLQPQAGTITVDGTLIDSSNIAAWQRAIGYVPQHIYLADTSVAENIAFGAPKAAIDMQAVERAARAAQIHDFITRELAQGYATVIGERGVRLSGGQRQRIGIARALYKDPPILLMDEATSAIDGETEATLNEAISRFSGTKTLIIVAHKKASLQNCQRLISIQPTQQHVDSQAENPPAQAKQ